MRGNFFHQNFLKKLNRLLVNLFLLAIFLFQQSYVNLLMLKAEAAEPIPTGIDFNAVIKSRDDNLANGKSKIKFSIQQSVIQDLGDQKFTAFLFFGDDFYKNYQYFTGKYSDFKELEHEYTKHGSYKPLLIVYSETLKSRVFKFLDPIIVEQKDAYKPIAQGATVLKTHDAIANTVTVKFSGLGSFDPQATGSTNLTYYWDFGDSGSTNTKNLEISHTYKSAGSFSPTLIVETIDGRRSDKYELPSITIDENTIIDYNKRSFAADIIPTILSKINQAPLLDAKVAIGFKTINENLKLSTKKFTVFVFYGDNFYRSYEQFTNKFSEFPSITHIYKEPGSYKPLVIAYSSDLQDRLFKFLDPIQVTKVGKDVYLPIAQARLIERVDDRNANTVTANFSAEGSFDPIDNSSNSLNYLWDYGDGSQSEITNQDISHIYNAPGTFNPSLTVKTADGRTSTKYDLEPIIISKEVVCLESRDSWINIGVCQADCGGIAGNQLQANLCDEERYIECVSPECRSNSFTILNDYVEAEQYLSFDADTSGFDDESKIAFRYIISSASEQTREQIYKQSRFYIDEAGSYSVTLEIYENSFKASTYTQVIEVAEANKPPVANASADKYTGEESLQVNFDASASYDPEGRELSYEWDFGNNELVSGVKVTRNYTDLGTYRVSLKVTDDRGLASIVKLNDITVTEKNYPPNANFVQNVFDCKVDEQGKIALEQKLDDKFFCSIELDGLLSSDPNGNISNYTWSVSFYNPVTEQTENLILDKPNSPKFTSKFDKFGIYNTQLTVTDAGGLSDIHSSQFEILEPSPVLKAEVQDRVNDLENSSSTLTFSANGSIYYQNKPEFNPGAAILDYIWDFGDGSNGQGLVTVHQYTKAGVYSPILRVNIKTDENKTVLARKNLESIVVTGVLPVVGSLSFSNLQAIENEESSIDAVTFGSISREQYKWIYRAYEKDTNGKTILADRSSEFNEAYGEVASSILDAPQSFTEAGQYQLVHQLDDKPILSETLTVLPNQIPIPNLQLTYSPGSNYVAMSAEGSYDPKNYEINSYEWDFNDGTTAQGITASHTYLSSGIYYIKLTVVDSRGQVANAFSKAIVVGDFADTISDVPQYVKVPDEENSDEVISADLMSRMKFQSTDDPVSDFDNVANIPNNDNGTPILGLVLPSEGVCTTGSAGSCQCKSSYASNISISSVIFDSPNESRIQDRGAATVEILGSNFCQAQHAVKVSVDGGDLEDRPSVFVNNGKLVAKLKAKDFRGSSLKIKVNQQATSNNLYYSAEKTFTTPSYTPELKTYKVQDGNSVKIDYNIPNIFIEGANGYGNAYHIFRDAMPVVYDSDTMIYSKNLRLETGTANQAKLKIHLNGNRFDGIRVWVNGSLVLSKDPAAGNKFYDLVSDAFTIATGPLDLQIKIIGPSTNGVQVKAVTVYTAPPKPTINNLKLDLFGDKNSKKKTVTISMDTTPNTRLQAVHLNRKSTQGTNAGKYKILQALTSNGNNTGSKVNLTFGEENFMPGTHCVYFYLTNGSKSDAVMEDYIKNNLVKPFNQATAQGKFAFINQSQFNYLQGNALSIQHGVCFNEDHQVNLKISSPETPIITQQNNQTCEIQLSSDAPNDKIRDGWIYEVQIFDGANQESSSHVIDVPFNKPEHKAQREQIKFDMSRDYLGDRNMVIRAHYYDPDTYLTYVGEVSTQLNVVEDKSPIAKVTTDDIKKLILEPSDNPNERATFLGYNSYDPNRASKFGSHINDGIRSYAWQTQFKNLEATADAEFTSLSSNYDPHANVFYIGPSKDPGIYRAQLIVEDFYKNSASALSDSVQVIRPGQSLVASLSVNNASKIFEPDLSGKSEVSLNARVKVITAKNNPPISLGYKFIYNDGLEENGSVSIADVQINKYIDLKTLTERKHTYVKGEYNPQLEVSASFTDGHAESWTVSAGTVTIAKLPTLVAFTPIIANLGPKDIPNPGFKAELKVTSKSKYGTKVSAFGWDFGDGTSWTYAGANPDTDFMKASVTDTKHTYSDVGTYQIKFWVKTIDEPEPIAFALKPLVIRDIPAPVITSLMINKQADNVKVSDEEIITIEAEIATKITLQRMEVQVYDKGTNEVMYSKTLTGNVATKFRESFTDLYLSPGRYILDILVFDDLEQRGAGDLEFVVEKTKIQDIAIDMSDLENILKRNKNYTYDRIQKIPAQINKRLKEIRIYNNSKLIKSYTNVLDDTTRYMESDDYSEEAIPDSNNGEVQQIDDRYLESDLTYEINEGNNSIYFEATLPNGKIIKSKTFNIILDSIEPLIEIDTPVDYSTYTSSNLILAGDVYDDNLSQLFYKINNGAFKEFTANKDIDETDLWTFEKEIDLSRYQINLNDRNIVEIMSIDKAGNKRFEHKTFFYNNSTGGRKFLNTTKFNLDDPFFNDKPSDCVLPFVNNTVGFSDGSYPSFDGSRYTIPQGKAFDIAFNANVCDDNELGTERTNFAFNVNPAIEMVSVTNQRRTVLGAFYTLDNGQLIDTIADSESSYRTYIDTNLTPNGDVDSSSLHPYVTQPYFLFEGMNSQLGNRFDIDVGNMKDVWSSGSVSYYLHAAWINELNKTGTNVTLDPGISFNVVPGNIGDAIPSVSYKTIPDVLFAGHNIDHLEMTIAVKSVTPFSASNLKIYQYRNPTYRIQLDPILHGLQITPMTAMSNDSYGNYMQNFKITADNLPALSGGDKGHKIHITLSNQEDSDFVLAQGFVNLNVLPLPEKYLFVEIEEKLDGLSPEQIKKEKGFVSLRPKNFNMHIHYIDDDGLIPEEKLEGFDPSKSLMLNNLLITKYDYANKSSVVNGQELSFKLTKTEASDKYPGYHKSTYESLGLVNGGTLFKDEVSLEFKVDLVAHFDKQKEAGFIFIDDPKRQIDQVTYKIDPIPVAMTNLSLDTDEIFFEPSFNTSIGENFEIASNEFNFSSEFDYDEKLTNKFRSISFNFKADDPDKPKKQKNYKPELKLNKSKSKNASIEFKGIGHEEDIDINDSSFASSKLNIPINLALNSRSDILLKKQEATDLSKTHTLVIPFSVVTKSVTDLDVRLKGIYETDTTPLQDPIDETTETNITPLENTIVVKFMDFPSFDNRNLLNQRVKIKGSDGKENMYLYSKISNIVGKKFDPLELELQLFDETSSTIGDPIIINGSVLKGNNVVSPIKSKGYNSSIENISITKKINTNLTQFLGESDFKTNMLDAEFVGIKLRRDRAYLATLVDQGDIDEYYEVDENDAFRYQKLEIDHGYRNHCSIRVNDRPVLSPYTIADESDLQYITINFSSASKNTAKIWVLDSERNDFKFSNDVIYTSTNFDTPFIIVNKENHKINYNGGIFNFNGFRAPEDKSRYSINFVVAKGNADPNVVAQGGFDSNTGVVCSIEVVKDIPNAEILIQGLEKGVLNSIPLGRSYPVIVSTNPTRSIDGVRMGIAYQDPKNPTNTITKFISYKRDGAFILVDLDEVVPLHQIGIKYTLIAELRYSDPTVANGYSVKDETRDFILVEDTEPIITFGTDGINDLGDPGSGNNDGEPNVIYAPAEQDYVFDRTITFTGIKNEDVNKISFKLIDKAANQEALNPVTVRSTSPTTNADEYTYNISTIIPFQRIEDIKEYILEAYFDNQRLSQTAEFFIIDDPVLKVDIPDFLEFDENGTDAILQFTANIDNGFERDMHVEYTTYIDGDPEKGLENSEPYTTKPIQGNELTVSQEFSRSIDINVSSLSVIRKGLLIADDLILLEAISGAIGTTVIANRKKIEKTFSTLAASAMLATENLVKNTRISFGTKQPLFDFKIIGSDGNAVEFMDGSSSTYKLRVTSALNFGEVYLCQEVDQTDQCNEIETGEYQLDTFEEKGPFTFTLPDGKPKNLSTSYVKDLEIKAPPVIPGTNIGISTIRVRYYDRDRDSTVFLSAMTMLLSKTSDNWCITKEVARLKGLANPNLALPFIARFIDHATRVRDSISDEGIVVNNHPYTFFKNDLRGIKYDLWRLVPKTQGKYSISNPDAALGYCMSLADHIANDNNRVGLFRVFESHDARPDSTIWRSLNYKVYWLDKNRFEHIYLNHGYQANIPRFNVDTKFLSHIKILHLIEEAIVGSKNNERGFVTGYTDTAFQKDFGYNIGVSKVDVGDTIKILQIRTADSNLTEGIKNRIQTAFPLHRNAVNIKSIQ